MRLLGTGEEKNTIALVVHSVDPRPYVVAEHDRSAVGVGLPNPLRVSPDLRAHCSIPHLFCRLWEWLSGVATWRSLLQLLIKAGARCAPYYLTVIKQRL